MSSFKHTIPCSTGRVEITIPMNGWFTTRHGWNSHWDGKKHPLAAIYYQVFSTAHLFLPTRAKNALHALILDNAFLYPKSKLDANCFVDWMSIVFLCFCTEFSLIPCQCRNNCHGTHILGATQMGRENVRFAKLASPISTNSNAKGAPRPPFFPTEGVSENVVLWGSFGMQGRFQVEVWERGIQQKFVKGYRRFRIRSTTKALKTPQWILFPKLFLSLFGISPRSWMESYGIIQADMRQPDQPRDGEARTVGLGKGFPNVSSIFQFLQSGWPILISRADGF